MQRTCSLSWIMNRELWKNCFCLNIVLTCMAKTLIAKYQFQSIVKQDWVAFMSQPYWVEVDLNLRLKWGWDEIESKFSWNPVEVELSWSWYKFTLNTKGRNWAFIGVGLWFKICFRSTYVAEQHMFSMLLLISSN